MTKHSDIQNGNRLAEFYTVAGGYIEVQCTIGENVSRSFPFKQYKTIKGAKSYARKFLEA